MGHLHENTVIRSCFGGADETWIVTGDEGEIMEPPIWTVFYRLLIRFVVDRSIRVWHRDTGDELEVLEGHKAGGTNAVSWNPQDDSVFASCSDDGTVRIWEAMDPPQQHSHFPSSQAEPTGISSLMNYSPKSTGTSPLPLSEYLGGSFSALGSLSSSRSLF